MTVKGSAGSAAYASSRAATESFSRVAAIELAPHNILVNVVSPGLIDTQPKPLPPQHGRALARASRPAPGAPRGAGGGRLGRALPGLRRCQLHDRLRVSVDGGETLGRRHSGAIIDDDPRYDWVTGRERG